MLNNLFGEKKPNTKDMIETKLLKIIETGGFSLSFETKEDKAENRYEIDVFGEDEDLLKAKGGKLLAALQTCFLRTVQNKFPEEKIFITVDSSGFWKESEEKLLSLTDQLIAEALETNSSVSFKKALPPRQRRLVHERASGNTGVRSVSSGEGVYKIIKISPDNFRDES